MYYIVCYTLLYPWYYMTQIIQKILVHGLSVAKFDLLPIGQLSKEDLKARNKDVYESY